MKKIALLCCALIIAFSFASCASVSENEFYGGELLDDSKMSEIKSSVFATETAEDKSTSNPTKTEKNSETKIHESEYNENTEEISDGTAANADVVFWTKSGEVWHLSEDCRHLKKSTSIISGTLDEAIDQGKKRACSSCGN